MRPDNTSPETVMNLRRQRVAQLRVMGLTQRDIWKALAQGDAQGTGRIINPKTREPYSLGTINNDIQTLEQEWRDEAAKDTALHQSRQLAEIQAIKVKAFSQQNPELALKAINTEIKLLGTAAPQRIELDVSFELVMEFVDAVRKLGHEPEPFMRKTIDRASYQH